MVQIGTGLTASDRVIETPPDGVAQGDIVKVIGSAGSKLTGNDVAKTQE